MTPTSVHYIETQDRPVGLAVVSDRLFAGFPNWHERHEHSLLEIRPNGEQIPFPSLEINQWPKDKKSDSQFVGTHGMTSDANNHLWILDAAKVLRPEGRRETIQAGAKLVQMDVVSSSVIRSYSLAVVAEPESFLNEVQIDLQHKRAYISDSNLARLLVLNLETGDIREVLREHPDLKADPTFVIHMNSKPMLLTDGTPFTVHVNAIALSKEEDPYLYFVSESNTKLYRIPTSQLAHFDFDEEQLSIECVAEVGQVSGMLIDSQGRFYFSSPHDSAIKRWSIQNQSLEILWQGKELLWPDAMALNNNQDKLYIALTQIGHMPFLNQGHDLDKKPYRIACIPV